MRPRPAGRSPRGGWSCPRRWVPRPAVARFRTWRRGPRTPAGRSDGARRAWLGGRPDRHHDVDIAAVAHRLEDARRQRALELEGELLGVHVRQDVGEVLGIEGDRGSIAFDLGLDLADVVAHLGVGSDGDAGVAVRADLELDDV